MKKSKITLSLVSGLVGLVALTSCSGPRYSPEGYILTYKDSTGTEQHYTADDLFGSYYKDSSSVQTMFDSVYKLIVRNYFKVEDKGIAKYDDIVNTAKRDVDGIKKEAKQKAESNSTKYDDEFDALCKSNGCENEEELLEHFIYEHELEEFNEQFNEGRLADLRDGVTTEGHEYDGYLNHMLPYHVRHILLSVSGGGSTKYWDSTISKADAQKFYNFGEELRAGTSFGELAAQYNQDPGSKENFGETQIVDRSTGFVPEFKLGMYAYENIYGVNKEAAKASRIGMDADTIADYKAATQEGSSSILSIPYGAFVALDEYKDVTKDELNRPINHGEEVFFPRNIIFNKYFNRHSVALISAEGLKDESSYTVADGKLTSSEDTLGNGVVDQYKTSAFKEVLGEGNGWYLCSSEGNPILAVRAGTDSYQGVHFITIERSPFANENASATRLAENTVNGVTLSDYYTTKYVRNSDYPHTADGTKLQTYVNFYAQKEAEQNKRADSVKSLIQGFDSDLNKYIYKEFLASEGIKFEGEGLKIKEAIDNWLTVSSEVKEFNEGLDWSNTWEQYLNSLKQQKVERNKLVSEYCAIKFLNGNKGDAAFQEGGVCYDNQVR